jgi:hypothetical protein
MFFSTKDFPRTMMYISRFESELNFFDGFIFWQHLVFPREVFPFG